jgi:hypothetical protein
MSTPAQISANQSNSQYSTGPKTGAGKAASAQNNFRHGLVPGVAFKVLPNEDQAQFDQLLDALRSEHNPVTTTEAILVEGMAQAHWLGQRAASLESSCFDPQTGQITDGQQLALYLRYQNTHRRAFHKCLNDLLKVRAEKRKEQIGFESQQRAQEEHKRKQDKEERAKERHKWDIFLAEAKVDHQDLVNLNREMDRTHQLAGIKG